MLIGFTACYTEWMLLRKAVTISSLLFWALPQQQCLWWVCGVRGWQTLWHSSLGREIHILPPIQQRDPTFHQSPWWKFREWGCEAGENWVRRHHLYDERESVRQGAVRPGMCWTDGAVKWGCLREEPSLGLLSGQLRWRWRCSGRKPEDWVVTRARALREDAEVGLWTPYQQTLCPVDRYWALDALYLAWQLLSKWEGGSISHKAEMHQNVGVPLRAVEKSLAVMIQSIKGYHGVLFCFLVYFLKQALTV